MRIQPRIIANARVLLGLVFVVFGLNGFLSFIPMPPPQGTAGMFMAGLAATGYFFPLLKGTEVVVGALLLSGRYVPLALTVLAPITVNIVAMHVFLAPSGLPLALLIVAAQLLLAWSYRRSFAGVLAQRAAPVSKHAGMREVAARSASAEA